MSTLHLPSTSITALEHADTTAMALGLTRRSIQLEGHRVSYLDEGAGPPVLLLHGAPLTSLAFVRVIRALGQHHRVLAPDLPGFGDSEVPPGFAGTLESYASFVERFCRALDLDRLVVYVNDASGSFGLAAAARMASRVAGLVVADTVQIPLTGAAWIVRQILTHVVSSRLARFLNRKLNLLPWLVASVAPWLRPFARAERLALVREFDTEDKRERVIDLFEQMGRDQGFMRQAAALTRQHLADKPTLILYGQLDPMRLIGAAACFRRMFRNSIVRIVPREEHFPILASGERVGRIVHEWISDACPRSAARGSERADGIGYTPGICSARASNP